MDVHSGPFCFWLHAHWGASINAVYRLRTCKSCGTAMKGREGGGSGGADIVRLHARDRRKSASNREVYIGKMSDARTCLYAVQAKLTSSSVHQAPCLTRLEHMLGCTSRTAYNQACQFIRGLQAAHHLVRVPVQFKF